MSGLTFADLSAANRARCQRWHPGFPDDETWTGADWSNALGGEAGELAEAALVVVAYAGKVQNTVKKIRRYEMGTNTDVDKPLEELLADLDAEMADVGCYLDLLATKYGRDLAGAIVAKFNAVSERQGFPDRLSNAAAVDVYELREQGVRVLDSDQCCELACSGGACESCPCCQAGWCVWGTDELPDHENDAENYRIWLEVAAEHNPVARRLLLLDPAPA